MEMKHKAYRQLCDYYNNGGKKTNSHMCTYAQTRLTPTRQSLDVMLYLPAVPTVPMTTEQLADKVTFSSWGSVIARPRHATERDRGGGEMRTNIKLWGEEVKEIWPTVIEDTTRVKFNLWGAQVRLMLGVCWCEDKSLAVYSVNVCVYVYVYICYCEDHLSFRPWEDILASPHFRRVYTSFWGSG